MMRSTALLAVILPLFFVSQAGYAQILEEIIVTAQKREQSLQDVPISISAVMGDVIQEQNLSDLQDLTELIPNVIIKEGGANDNLFIRGIGSGNNIGFEQSVGTFVDGLYFGRGRHSRAQFMDIERVEVLRGTQSTFFGNSTIAGAINIATKKPTDEWEGYSQVLYNPEFEEREIEVASGGPVTDTLGIRVAARIGASDGYLDNISTGNIEPEEHTKQLRGTVRWTPNEVFDATYKFDYAQFDVDGEPPQTTECPPRNNPPAGTCALFLLANRGVPARTDFVKESNGLPVPFPQPTPDFFSHRFQDAKLLSHNLTMNYQLGGHTLTSVTGFIASDDNESIDPDQGPFGVLVVARQERYDQWSQELRITSPTGNQLEYIAGLYYQNSELTLDTQFSNNLFALPPGPGSLAGTQFRDFDQDEETIALFGQFTYRINEQFSVSAGLRWSEVEKDAVNTLDVRDFTGATNSPQAFRAAAIFFGGIEATTTNSSSDSDVTPEFTLNWTPMENILAYFHYAQGFKSGGFNADFDAGANPSGFSFSPEEVESFEIGAKTTWLEGAMTLNVALFRSDFSDLQVSEFDGVSAFVVKNAATSVSQGLELDAVWQATERFRISLSFSLLDSEFDEFTNANCTAPQVAAFGNPCTQDLSGQTTMYAPDVSGTLRLEYLQPLPYELELISSVDIIHSDDYFTATDLDPLLLQGSFTKVDARVALGSADGKWDVAFVGRNLTDELTFGAGDDMPGGAFSALRLVDKPRSAAIQASYRW